jgi:hypothetical protein
VKTDRTIPKNPDVIICDNEKGTHMFMDINSEDRDVIKEQTEKILQYQDLTIQIQHVCNAKTKVMPVMIEATGTFSKSFRKYLNNRPEKHEIKELQKTTMLGIAHVLRKVLI